MSSVTLYNEIIERLRREEFFSDYRYLKSQCDLCLNIPGGKQYVSLRHYRDWGTDCLVIGPGYCVRFDVLHKWFEKICVKPLRDQRDSCTIAYGGYALDQQCYFSFKLDKEGFEEDYENFRTVLTRCAAYVFKTYGTLEKLYKKTVQSVLDGKMELPNFGADWMFIDLALCKLVEPSRFKEFRQIVKSHADCLYNHWTPHQSREPNVAQYYDRLDEIFDHLENIQL